ncbi:hypothetical protein AB0D24_38470 [Streptomyces javensis]|uniref:hypothetical protein n=1 Tax=Streptomyces javensis TaxID=114698 RepID=UPI00340C90AC
MEYPDKVQRGSMGWNASNRPEGILHEPLRIDELLSAPVAEGVRAPAARHRHPPENRWNRTLVCRYRASAHSHSVKDEPLYTK